MTDKSQSTWTVKVANSPIFTVAAGITSLLGFLLALFFGFFPAGKKPLYAINSFNLINDSSATIDNLEIKYKTCNNDKCKLDDVKQLTISRILFWNAGKRKIDKTDIDSKPILIKSKSNKILNVQIIGYSNKNSGVKLESTNNNILFNFIDPSDSVIIEVIHTGASDKNIFIDGYIEESLNNGEIKKVDLKEKKFIVITFLVLVSSIFLIVLFYCNITMAIQRNVSKSLPLNNHGILNGEILKWFAIPISVLIPMLALILIAILIYISFTCDPAKFIYYKYNRDLYKVFNEKYEPIK